MLLKLPKDVLINHLLPLLSYSDIRSVARINKQFRNYCTLDSFWRAQYVRYYLNDMKKKENITWFEFFIQVYIRMQQKYPHHPPLPSSLTWTDYHKLLQSSLILPICTTNQILGHVYIMPGITTLKMLFDQYAHIIASTQLFTRHRAFSINSLRNYDGSDTFKYFKEIAYVQFERMSHQGVPSTRSPGISVITKVTNYVTNHSEILEHILNIFNTSYLDYIIPADHHCPNLTELPSNMLDILLMPIARPPKKAKPAAIQKHGQYIKDYLNNFISSHPSI